jgi:hypothetical protein
MMAQSRRIASLALRRAGFLMLAAMLSCFAFGFVLNPGMAHAAGTAYYVNCATNSNGSGSQSSPWNTLSSVNATTFQPGDQILFDDGTTCNGMLAPKGSGNSSASITISSYGSGASPVINGGTNSSNAAAVELTNQSYWIIENLTVTGGYYRNVWITGNQANTTFTSFQLNNLTVHSNGDLINNFWMTGTGGVIVEPCNATTTLSNIVINGVTAYDEHQSGIQVGHYELSSSSKQGNAPDCSMGLGSSQPANTVVQNVTIENSTSYSNDADGAEIFSATTINMEHNVFYGNGNGAGGAGIGLNGEGAWWDNTNGMTAQFNEAYRNKTGKGDGGGLDNDMNSYNNLVQYNYLHDNDAYCVSVFSAAHEKKNFTTIRYNICTNNGQNSSHASSGDIYVKMLGTGGTVDGLAIYGNTFARASTSGPAMNDEASFTGTQPDFFKDNIVYRAFGQMLYTSDAILQVNDNDYWTTGTAGTFVYNSVSYTSFSSYKSGSGQDANSLNSDPKLNNPTDHSNGFPTVSYTLQSGSPAIGAGVLISNNGSRDFFGNSVSSSSAPNIGAYN